MTKIMIALLTACLLTVATPVAMAENPTEAQADCEENQPWIGYTTTEPLRQSVQGFLGDDATLNVCEGEHWDGEDNVQPNRDTGNSLPCTVVDPTNGFVGVCMDSDPNPQYPRLTGIPLALRLSWVNGAESTELFVAVGIGGVGHAGTYLGHCEGAGQLEGRACRGSSETLAGVYLRDHSLTTGRENFLATVVSAPGITRGYVDEGDCDQATYQEGAMTGDRTLCGRDNTAVSAELILP